MTSWSLILKEFFNKNPNERDNLWSTSFNPIPLIFRKGIIEKPHESIFMNHVGFKSALEELDNVIYD